MYKRIACTLSIFLPINTLLPTLYYFIDGRPLLLTTPRAKNPISLKLFINLAHSPSSLFFYRIVAHPCRNLSHLSPLNHPTRHSRSKQLSDVSARFSRQRPSEISWRRIARSSCRDESAALISKLYRGDLPPSFEKPALLLP